MSQQIDSKILFVGFEETLDNGEELDSGWLDVGTYDKIQFSGRASAAGMTMTIESRANSTQTPLSTPVTYTDGTFYLFNVTCRQRYMRFKWGNNTGSSVTQASMELKASYGSSDKLSVFPVGVAPSVFSQAALVQSVIRAQDPNGTFVNAKASRRGNFLIDIDNIAKTSFDELKTASRYAQIELKSAVDAVSVLRNHLENTNGGVDVNSSGEYRVYTNANAGATSLLESGERGRYIPGYEAECGIGVRIPSQTLSGTEYMEWGYFDDDNGVGYGKDATGVYVFIKRSGTKTKTYQSAWNKDNLDGDDDAANPSGYTLDLQDGVVTQIEFIWYGYGAIQWYINMKDSVSNRGSVPVLVHTLLPDDQTSIAQPNLPISVKIDNGDQSTAREMFVGGRQFSIYGQPSERYRINGERRTNVSVTNTAWTPLISFRRKSNIGNNQSVELSAVNIVPSTNVIYTFVVNGTLTGASFGNLTDVATTETVVESDVSASAISGGTFFGGEYVATGNNRAETLATLTQLDFDFVNIDTVTLVARSIAASGTIDVVTLNVKEQW